jgi:hypothetical protein
MPVPTRESAAALGLPPLACIRLVEDCGQSWGMLAAVQQSSQRTPLMGQYRQEGVQLDNALPQIHKPAASCPSPRCFDEGGTTMHTPARSGVDTMSS